LKQKKLNRHQIDTTKGVIDEIKSIPVDNLTGLSNFIFRNVDELYPSKKYFEVISSYDVLWMMGKFLQIKNFPGWQGYMNKITQTRDHEVSTIVSIPFIMAPPNDINTIYTSMKLAIDHIKDINLKTILITFDLPLYMKSLNIVLSSSKDSNIKSIVLRLGGFHILMSFFRMYWIYYV